MAPPIRGRPWATFSAPRSRTATSKLSLTSSSSIGPRFRPGPFLLFCWITARAFVMAGRSRPKDGVASARLCPAIHVFGSKKEDVDARDKRGHDDRERPPSLVFFILHRN